MSPKFSVNYYDLIRKQIVTEKSQQIDGKYSFVVSPKATKVEVKAAIEHLFNVKVKSVNTLIRKGKKKIFRGRNGQQSDIKKAMVTLEAGQSIDLTFGA